MSSFTSSSEVASEPSLSLSNGAVYDRQIRLWGHEAQSRIQNSKVLICGVSGLSAEVCKNIVLAGVNIHIWDDQKVETKHLVNIIGLNHSKLSEVQAKNTYLAEFFLPYIKSLNTLAETQAFTCPAHQLTESFLSSYNMIIMTGSNERSPCAPNLNQETFRIANLCRKFNQAFMYINQFGYDGLFISDFGPSYFYKPDENPNQQREETLSEKQLEEKKLASMPKEVNFPSFEVTIKTIWSDFTQGKGRRMKTVPAVYIVDRLLWNYQEQQQTKTKNNHDNENSNTSSSDMIQEQRKKVDYDALAQLIDAELEKNKISANINSETYQFLNVERIKQKFAECVTCLEQNNSLETISVCAVVGGLIGQEVIKYISGKGEPANNIFTFNGDNNDGIAIKCPNL